MSQEMQRGRMWYFGKREIATFRGSPTGSYWVHVIMPCGEILWSVGINFSRYIRKTSAVVALRLLHDFDLLLTFPRLRT